MKAIKKQPALSEQIEELKPTQEQVLPSGRSVVLKVAGGCEELEVRSPGGEVEVRITLTESGPVVTLKGARLEVEAAEAVAFKCRRFEVETSEGIDMRGKEMRVKTQGDIHMDGAVIRLNCENPPASS